MTTKTFYDAISKTYDQRFVSDVALIENELATANLPTKNVLDLGCGTGLYLEYCQPEGYIGVDISAGMLDVARCKFPARRFVQADMAALPLPSASVDSVVSLFGSFSYSLMAHRCVAEIRRVLRPGGQLVIMAYGQRYITRPSHIAPQLPFWTYTKRQVKHLFRAFAEVTITGLNWQIERLPWRWYAHLETATVARLWPDVCYFLIVEGKQDAEAIPVTERIRCSDRPLDVTL